MINRIKLALKLIFGYDIVVYEDNTKIVKLVINGNFDIMGIKYDYAIVKGHIFKDNNGEIRYFEDDNKWNVIFAIKK